MRSELPTNSLGESSKLVAEKQLAERWSISVRTLQNRRVLGTGIAFVKIGASVRYRMVDVLAFEASFTRSSTSEARHA